MFNILLIEEYIILRTGIKALIDVEPELRLFAEATSIQEALTITPIGTIDLIITDIKANLETTKNDMEKLRTSFPEARILVFTSSENEYGAVASLATGAAGYISKEASGEELLRAINQLLRASADIETPEVSTSA